jgi:hypothetical protein
MLPAGAFSIFQASGERARKGSMGSEGASVVESLNFEREGEMW